MNRRRFIQSLVAAFSLPAGATLPFRSATAALPAAAAVPTQARFWAIYISGLHGECTPSTLQNLLHIPEGDAKKYISQLLADGVIRPSPLLQKSVSKILKGSDDSLVSKVRKRLEMKAQADSDALDAPEKVDEAVDEKVDEAVEETGEAIDWPDREDTEDAQDAEAELSDTSPEVAVEFADDDEPVEPQAHKPEKIETQS